jgi:hypothetical protein
MGGLGNQMFQYALGRTLADKHNMPLVLDTSIYRLHHLRNYRLNHFNISGVWIDDRDWMSSSFTLVQEEPLFKYDPKVFRHTQNVVLFGYWQSEKYFQDIRTALYEEFTVKEPPTGINAQLLEEISAVHSVSVHIRRGDYANDANTNTTHGTLPISYYNKAFEMIGTNITHPHFYVFSDDPSWAQNNITTAYPIRFISHNSAEHDYEDFRLMSACKHHIIANSTFSWWGAWLGNYPRKVVIAPKKWFFHNAYETHELIPASWIQLE